MKRAIDRRQFGLVRAQGGPERIRIGGVVVPALDVKKYSDLGMVEEAAKRLA
jgi:hypothetical protein